MPARRKYKSKKHSRKMSSKKKHSRKHSSKKRTSVKSIRGHGDYHVGKSDKSMGVAEKYIYPAFRANVAGRYLANSAYYAGKKAINDATYGSAIGGVLGGALGGPKGFTTGYYAGGLAGGIGGAIQGAISGSGAYHIRSNSLSIPGTQIPSFDAEGRRCVRVTHREYVADITGSTSAFVNTQYQWNPGNSELFPYLSNIASQFSEYKCEGAIVELRSISGVSASSTNEALGYMCLAFDPNALAAAPTSKVEMDNFEFAGSGPPSANVVIPIECKRSVNVLGELYVNNGAIPSGDDARLYSMGQLNVAVGNQQSAYVLAELWISYDFCFYHPRVGYPTSSVASTHITSTSGMTTSAYFGTTQSYAVGSTFQPVLTGTTITLPTNMPLGNYLLVYESTGGSTTVVGPTITSSGGCADLTILVGDTVAQYRTPSVTAVRMYCVYFFSLNSTGGAGVLTFSNATFPSAPTNMDCTITGFNSNILT